MFIIKIPAKTDQVTSLFYNCRFYYRKEAQKCSVLCSGHVCGFEMAILIPKIGYNKKPVKTDQVTTLFYNYHFYN